MTTSGDRIDQLRSRLEVLPPSVSAETPVESKDESKVVSPKASTSKKRRRKLRKESVQEPSAPTAAVNDPKAAAAVAASRRNPLPLAPVPTTVDEPLIADLVGAEPELLTPPARQLSGSQQLEAINHWHEVVESQPVSLMDRFSKFMSGWATSFVIHTLLLIVFALLTFGMPQDRPLSLSLDNVDVERPDTETIDVSVNFEPIDASAAPELDDVKVEMLSDELAHESLEADDDLAPLDDLGMESLAGDGIGGGRLSIDGGKRGVAGESIDFFGSYAEGQRFIFVIDCSGSMMGERWRRAKYELIRSIDGLGNDQEFCVILYNSFTSIMMDGREVELLKANEENKERVSEWLDDQFPSGGTYPMRAITAAVEAEPDAIFLLSDGEIQDNSREFLLAKNKRKNGEDGDYSRIPVHTIALLSTFGQQLLKTIADENDGTFTRVGRR